MCLFGGKIGWMENFGEKMEEKNFGGCLVEGRGGKKNWWGLGVFSPGPPKCSLQNGEKTEWEEFDK